MLNRITHQFVDIVPDHLDEGVVYVCIPYETVVHRCCCGCGNEVVTPLNPLQWSVTFNGETVSLSPSIGNWSFPCRSHYWIRAGEVRVARLFTNTEIAQLRTEDRQALLDRYGPPDKSPSVLLASEPTWWQRVLRRMKLLRR
jgi:hypothetical protein